KFPVNRGPSREFRGDWFVQDCHLSQSLGILIKWCFLTLDELILSLFGGRFWRSRETDLRQRRIPSVISVTCSPKSLRRHFAVCFFAAVEWATTRAKSLEFLKRFAGMIAALNCRVPAT